MKKRRVGTTLDSLLDTDGTRDEVHGLAQKRVLAWQLEEAARTAGIPKAEMARRIGTSRAQVDRIFDPANSKVQLDTLQRVARALGRTLRVELV